MMPWKGIGGHQNFHAQRRLRQVMVLQDSVEPLYKLTFPICLNMFPEVL
jgi:hypothetical protein